MIKAFSMVELIFVIVLMGILASVGGNLLPDNRLLQYTNEAIIKIKETQKNAIGNDVNSFEKPWSQENNSTCITLDDSLHVVGSIQICFDEYGRPYDIKDKKLLLQNTNIIVRFNEKNNIIALQPISGYIIIN